LSGPTRLYVVGNGARPAVKDAAQRLVARIGDRADILDVDLEDRLDLSTVEADLIVVLGGDGALLSATRKLDGSQIPLLGINFGKLGFLAEARAKDLQRTVDDVLVPGRFRVTERMMLEATVRHVDGRTDGPIRGLNDAVVERWDSRTVTVHLLVDGKPATTYRGDGVIVSTPTGSTAHNLSAGGPILEPGMQGFVVSPMCPHSVSNRSIVLGPERVLEMLVSTGTRKPGLAVDGQVLVDLEPGDRVEVRRSDTPMQLAVPGGLSYFEVLRSRLHWSGQPPLENR
jgi:NAD+ kinase